MSAYDPPIPAVASGARDLDDEECAELDALLARVPEPFRPMSVVALDGFLCGVLVQPVLIEPQDWLPYVFDTDARLLPTELAVDIGQERAVALVLRRHRALARALAEEGAFDPLVADLDDEEEPAPPDGAPPGEGAADGAPPAGAGSEEADNVPAVSRPLVDWVAGFHFANGLFPGLEELDHDEVGLALARIYRHLPAEDEAQRELSAAIDADLPLASVDEAIDDLVAAVADIDDFTRELRFRVDTVRREAPKVGRNDPCPCGSGRKYKRCHGAGVA